MCPAPNGHLSPGISITVSHLLQQEATPEDFANHNDIADWLIRTRGVTPGSDRASHSRQFLLAARFLDPESQDAVEALIEELGLEFMGAEKEDES